MKIGAGGQKISPKIWNPWHILFRWDFSEFQNFLIHEQIEKFILYMSFWLTKNQFIRIIC